MIRIFAKASLRLNSVTSSSWVWFAIYPTHCMERNMVFQMEVSFEFGSCLEIAWSMGMYLLRHFSFVKSARIDCALYVEGYLDISGDSKAAPVEELGPWICLGCLNEFQALAVLLFETGGLSSRSQWIIRVSLC